MNPQTAPELKTQTSPSWHKRKWVQNSVFIVGTILAIYAMVYADVVLRARESYLEGEKYWR